MSGHPLVDPWFETIAEIERAVAAVRPRISADLHDDLAKVTVACATLRKGLLSLAVKAPLRIGYDRARSKDLHGLFVNCRIAARFGR